LFALIHLLLKPKDTIIYTRDYLGAIFATVGFKVIYECHYLPERGSKLFWYLAKLAEKQVVISEDLKKAFARAGVEEKDILVAPDGVDLAKFDIELSKEKARQKLNLPLNKNIIVYTGHLYSWKGADILAQAAGQLDNTIAYFIGGISSDIESFKEKYADLIKEGKIQVVGHKPQKEIPVWLKAADALVLPNTGKEKISKYYTSPLKLFEYMASQRPIIASRLPSLTTVLNDSNCVFFRPDDANDLVKKINQVLADAMLSKRISDRAYQEVGEYSWERRAEKILEFTV
jgi:glycosyltransferase involved in cell wall biosynthesis